MKKERPVEIRRSATHGRGVFATRDIRRGSLLEACPVLVGDEDDLNRALHGYPFEWGPSQSAIALGYGSFLNHSFAPNATHREFINREEMRVYALRDIKAGEEVTIDYVSGGDPEDLWFDVDVDG